MIYDFSKIKGLLFDKDGTLFDFDKTWNSWNKRILREVSEKSGVDLEKLAASIEFDLNTEKLMPQSIVIAGTHKQVTAALHRELPDWDFDHLESYLLDIVIETPQYEVIPLKSFFENLKSKGFLLGVMTNDAEKSARAHLINAGVYSLLDLLQLTKMLNLHPLLLFLIYKATLFRNLFFDSLLYNKKEQSYSLDIL